jgi:methionyl-tRNA synthetase
MLQIKCRTCNSWNDGGDYCKNCGAVISMEEEERLSLKQKKEQLEKEPKDKFTLFVEKYKHHHNIVIRNVFYIFYSVYMIFTAIGAFLHG